MKNLFTLQKMISAGLLITLLYGCMPPLYFPNGINAPLISKKGQVILNGATDGSCTDVQFAAGASDKIGVLVNINFGDVTNESSSNNSYSGSNGSYSNYSSTTYKHDHIFIESGAGVFNKIGTYGRTETFGLIGFGSAESSGGGNSKSGNYTRFAVQSDIGIEANFFEGIFSCRMGYLDLNAHHSSDNYSSYNYSHNYNDPSSFFIDPAITLRMGWKEFKITTQYGVSIPLSGDNGDWNPGWFTMGVQLKFM